MAQERNRGRSLTLGQLGEDEVVRRLTKHLPRGSRCITGAGDDCAVLTLADSNPEHLMLFKTDCLVEGIHFLPDTDSAGIGWKALCRCISDIAAMAGTPREAVITLAAPKSTPWLRLEGINQGLRRAAQRYEIGLVGGETSSVPEGAPIFINVAMLGDVAGADCLLRSNAQPGDSIFVTGRLGGSRRGWHLKFTPRLKEAQWLARNFPPSAMMDLSDGLGKDLPRLAKSSDVEFKVELSSIPRRQGASLQQAIGDGEDFELLFTVPTDAAESLLAHWKKQFPRVGLSRIGRMVQTGEGRALPVSGWDHFA